MNESLFQQYIAKFFPTLQKIIEKVNGKRNNKLTYLHKGENAMLTPVYSVDNKWESTSVNTTYVAADFVALDSPLSIKRRSSISSANGKLPKIGMSKHMQESDITAINIMEAQGKTAKEISAKLSNDPVACSVGIDERNEYNFLYALCNGYVGIEDKDNPNVLMRLKFNYLPENTFGATTKNVASIADIKNILARADSDGNTIIKICISKAQFNKLKATDEAKQLIASYNGQSYTSDTVLPVPTASRFNEAFADDNGGVEFMVIDRSITFEIDGKRKSVKPWNDDRMVFICNDVVGSLVYGTLAEQTHRVKNVDYQVVDTYKLISRYSTTNPLVETTSGQAVVAPIIEDVDQIYVYDISEAEEVDQDEEDKDATDTKVTLWGNTYSKSDVTSKLGIASNTSDVNIIKAVNQLSDEDESALKKALVMFPKVTPASLAFTNAADATGKEIAVSSTGTVTASSSQTWCTVSVSGKKVTVKVDANASTARTADVSVTQNGKTTIVVVSQDAAA